MEDKLTGAHALQDRRKKGEKEENWKQIGEKKKSKQGGEGCQKGQSGGTKNTELLSRKWPMDWARGEGSAFFLR